VLLPHLQAAPTGSTLEARVHAAIGGIMAAVGSVHNLSPEEIEAASEEVRNAALQQVMSDQAPAAAAAAAVGSGAGSSTAPSAEQRVPPGHLPPAATTSSAGRPAAQRALPAGWSALVAALRGLPIPQTVHIFFDTGAWAEDEVQRLVAKLEACGGTHPTSGHKAVLDVPHATEQELYGNKHDARSSGYLSLTSCVCAIHTM
jgi:hypothetical protein